MAPVALEEGAVEQSAGDVSEASAPPAWTWRDSSASPCAAPPPDGTPLKKTHRMRKGPEGHLVRAGSLVDSVRGDPLKRAQSNLALQGASTLPTEDRHGVKRHHRPSSNMGSSVSGTAIQGVDRWGGLWLDFFV